MASIIQQAKDLLGKLKIDPSVASKASSLFNLSGTANNFSNAVSSFAPQVQTAIGNLASNKIWKSDIVQRANPVANFNAGINQIKPIVNQAVSNWNMTPQQRSDVLRPQLAKQLETSWNTPQIVKQLQSYAMNVPSMLENRWQESTKNVPSQFKPFLEPAHLTGKLIGEIPALLATTVIRSPEEQNYIQNVINTGSESQKAQLQNKLALEQANNIAFGATSAPIESGLTSKIARTILRVQPNATEAEINSAYKVLMKEEAPRSIAELGVKGKSNAAKVLNNARDILLNEAKTQAGNITKSLTSGVTPFQGLMNESPAQTAARRKLSLTPGDIYTGEKTAVSGTKSSWAVPQLVDDFEKQMESAKVTVKEKVNVLDYLKTPENVLNKIGLGNEAKLLRSQWDSYLNAVPKEIDRIRAWASQVTPEGNQRIFKYLDGQKIDLNASELKVASEIKSYLKDWADKLNLPQDSRIGNYITHIFENDIQGKEFPQEIADIIRKGNIPGQTYDPFLMKRYGIGGYVEDTWRALNAYVKRAVRKYNLDPALEKIKMASNNLEESQYNYVKRYIDRVQMRPTELETLTDNLIKSTPVGYRFGQRPTNVITQNLRQATYRGLLGLNPGSALKNLTQGTNTYAELGEKYTLVGYSNVIKNLRNLLSNLTDNELYRVGVLNDEFIQDKTIPVFKSLLQKIDSGLFYMFETAEKINRGAAYWGAKAKYLNQGLSEAEAINKAKEVVRKTQFAFGRIDTPVALQSDIAKTLGQFQSFTLKQFEFLGNKVANKEWAGLIRYIGSTFAIALTIGKAFGWESKDLFPSLRFGMPPALQFPYEVARAVLNTPDKYGNTPTFEEKLGSIGKSMISFIPGGGQVRKTIQGLQAYGEGASYTPAGNLRFQVEQTPGNFVKSALFGQYSTPEGQEYIQNLGKSQGEITYEKYKKLKATNPEKARQNMLIIKKTNPSLYNSIERIALDEQLGTTAQEKKIRGLNVNDGSRARAVIGLFKKYPAGSQERAALLGDLIKKGVVTKEVFQQLKQMKEQGLY